MEKSKVLFGEAESIVDSTRNSLIAKRIKEETKKGQKTTLKNKPINNDKRQVLPYNKYERQ